MTENGIRKMKIRSIASIKLYFHTPGIFVSYKLYTRELCSKSEVTNWSPQHTTFDRGQVLRRINFLNFKYPHLNPILYTKALLIKLRTQCVFSPISGESLDITEKVVF